MKQKYIKYYFSILPKTIGFNFLFWFFVIMLGDFEAPIDEFIMVSLLYASIINAFISLNCLRYKNIKVKYTYFFKEKLLERLNLIMIDINYTTGYLTENYMIYQPLNNLVLKGNIIVSFLDDKLEFRGSKLIINKIQKLLIEEKLIKLGN